MLDLGTMANLESDDLTAEQLSKITATEEDLFAARLGGLKQSFMETMVKVATQQGKKEYSSSFLKEGTDKLISALEEHFSGLGYTVNLEDKVQKDAQGSEVDTVVFSVKWG